MTTAALARARTLLFVPGNRPERFDKALRSGADGIVVDLEDSVPPAAKAVAREALAARWPALCVGPVPVVVRINAAATDVGASDVDALARLDPPPLAVMVPKAESASDLARVADALPGAALLPLVETAAGLDALPQVARAPHVLRLVVGHVDFMADTGIACAADQRELDPLRFAVAMQTRLARLAPALDGVTASIDDAQVLHADVRRALGFGFGGKLCIHPRQVQPVHDALAPTAAELAWATRVLEADRAANGAAVQLDGTMIDLPVVLQARRTLARAGRG